MTSQSSSSFEGKVHQNKYLAAGVNAIHAIVSIKSNSPAASSSSSSGQVLGFAIDGSGSMAGDKWRSAKAALISAINLLPENAEFFVVRGGDSGDLVVPLQQATAANKQRAIEIVRNMNDGGGTYFSRWLRTARGEFAKRPAAIKVLTFLTDGKNEGELDPKILGDELRACQGLFETESRGVGDSYVPDELRRIQSVLGGSVNGFQRADELNADFAAIVERTRGLSRSSVQVQLWTPVGVKITSFKQMNPQIVDLTNKVQATANPRLSRVETGAWGEENRDYMVVAELEPSAVGQAGGPAKLLARVSLIYSENGVETEVKLNEGGQVLAEWTDDEKRSAVINPTVANYTGQGELAKNIQEGVAALTAGNEAEATRKLGKAMELAVATGNEEATKKLQKIITTDDKGTVKLNKGANKGDVVSLDTASTRTRRVAK